MKIPIVLNINGLDHHLEVKPQWTLLEVIREQLGLTGTKEGCGLGKCGACTVLVDNQPVNACLMLAVQAEDKTIVTIEGLTGAGHSDQPTPLQAAFVDKGAVQCGFCTPGLVLTSKALLDKNPGGVTAEEIKKALAGNLCRCTGYNKIVEAVQAVSDQRGQVK